MFMTFPIEPILLRRLTSVFTFALLAGIATPTNAVFPESDLRSYYSDYPEYATRPVGLTSTRPYLELLPRVAITGGGLEPVFISAAANGPPIVLPVERPYHPSALLSFVKVSNGDLAVYGYREGVCNSRLLLPERPLPESRRTMALNQWLTDYSDGTQYAVGQGLCDSGTAPPTWPMRLTNDEMTFGAPLRRTAIDGGQYDASPMVLKRNGLPWFTYYFGYHLGLVGNESNWDASNLAAAGDLVGFFRFPSPVNNFNLAALPPPWVEDDVIEYVNRTDFPNQPGGQYFYAVLAADKALLDSLPQWQRTGKTFKSGGYVSVCRFYGGKNGGPNTHFYSADDKECAALKAIPQLSYEGQTFAVNMPMPAKNAAQAVPGALRDCPIDSKPLYRVYNNASASNGRFVSNHRYLTERVDVTAAVAQGWVDEGHVMCVPN